MAIREKVLQDDPVSDYNRAQLEQLLSRHLAQAESVNACFEQSLSLLQSAILCCMAEGERSDDDMSAIAETLLMALNYTQIAYTRYLLKE